MSEWFEQRWAERCEREAQIRRVREEAAGAYEALWREIVAVMAAARAHGIVLETNGIPLACVVRMGPRRLLVKLDDARQKIVATSDDGETILELAICESGLVCIHHQGVPLDYERAAQLLLEPFIFSGSSPYASGGGA